MPATLLPSALLNVDQAAEILGTTAATLSVWRSKRRVNIPYVKIGRSVRYRLGDLERYIARQTVGGDSSETE